MFFLYYVLIKNEPWEILFRAVGSDDISIKITHCGICYADVVSTRNKYGDSMYPLVPG